MISASGSGEVRAGASNSDRRETAEHVHVHVCILHSFERSLTGLIKPLQFSLQHDNSLFAVSLRSLSHTDTVRCYLCPVHTRARTLYLYFLLPRMLFSPRTQNLWHPKCISGGPQVTGAEMLRTRARHLSDSSGYSGTAERNVGKRARLLLHPTINTFLWTGF